MQKRAAVSVFIILGFVLLIIAGGIFVARSYLLKSALERELSKAAAVPEKAKPIKNYFDECLYKLSLDIVRITAMQGGYLEIPDYDLPIIPRMPFGNRLSYNGIEVPYWFYETSNGVQRYQVPSLETIEEQISKRIEEEFIKCIDDLSQFFDQGYWFDINTTRNAEIEIQDDKIIVHVKMPVYIHLQDFDFLLEDHFAELEVPFGRMYKLARALHDYEDQTNFLEQKTMDALIASPDVPVSGTEFSCQQKTWSKSKVIEAAKDAILFNIGALRLKGSRYVSVHKELRYFTIDPGMDAFGLDVMFLYNKNWPTIIDIAPSDGDLLKADQFSQALADKVSPLITNFICINDWNFVYNVYYPVLITFIDENALNGEGFIFQFAEMVILKNNQPRENKANLTEFGRLKYPICENPNTEVDVYTYYLNKNEELVPLEDVDISFKCFTRKCYIGKSQLTNGDAMLHALFPQCLNGLVIGEKQGYYKDEAIISTNKPQVAALILEPLKKVNVTIKLIEKSSGKIRDPYESEQVIVKMVNKNNDFAASFVSTGSNEIKLIPGEYDIEALVLGNSTWPITIHGDEVEICVPKKTILPWNIVKEEKECFTQKMEDITVDQVIKGGVKFDFELTREKLYEGELTIYVMVDYIPHNYESLMYVYSAITENAKHPYFRYPE